MPLINSAGQKIGTVRAWQTAGGVSFRVTASGLPHGLHGIHVHAVGRCDPPEFTTAGRALESGGQEARAEQSRGPARRGSSQRRGRRERRALGATVTLPGATMATLLDADGSALVIHAQADDYMTDPSGNSGARIACAVIQPGAELR